jgi:hypothetical protein
LKPNKTIMSVMIGISLNLACLPHVSNSKEAEQEDAMQFALQLHVKSPAPNSFACFPLTMTISSWEHYLGSSEAYFVVYQLT